MRTWLLAGVTLLLAALSASRARASQDDAGNGMQPNEVLRSAVWPGMTIKAVERILGAPCFLLPCDNGVFYFYADRSLVLQFNEPTYRLRAIHPFCSKD